MEAEVTIKKEFTHIKLDDLSSVVSQIYEIGKLYKVWLFEASMGAGKTTFISKLCEYLAVEDHVSSPTFSLVNEYESSKIGSIYHFDFYRIEEEIEALDIGVEEYFYSGNLCLVEWPEMIPTFLPDSYLKIRISQNTHTTSRDIIITANGKGGIV